MWVRLGVEYIVGALPHNPNVADIGDPVSRVGALPLHPRGLSLCISKSDGGLRRYSLNEKGRGSHPVAFANPFVRSGRTSALPYPDKK